MPLIKDGRVVDDPWRDVGEDGDITGDEPIIVPFDRWRADWTDLKGRNGPLGIRLKSSQSPEEIAEDLGRFELVALEFPTMNDGRAFSYARLLRERHGFTGELRAVGAVIRDLVFFMRRCGFDSFEVADAAEVEGVIAALGDFSHAYQPAADRMPPAYITRFRDRSG